MEKLKLSFEAIKLQCKKTSRQILGYLFNPVLSLKLLWALIRLNYARATLRIRIWWFVKRMLFVQGFVWKYFRNFVKLWGFDFIQWIENTEDKEHPLVGFAILRSQHFDFYIQGTNIYSVRFKDNKMMQVRYELFAPIEEVSKFVPVLPESKEIQ
jgi:hypothetical protein